VESIANRPAIELLRDDVVGDAVEQQEAIDVTEVIILEPGRADQVALRDEDVGDRRGLCRLDVVDLAEMRGLLDPDDRVPRAIGLDQLVAFAELLGLDEAARAGDDRVLVGDAERAARRGGQLVDDVLGVADLGGVAEYPRGRRAWRRR
jgi:hypothetical protein